MTHSKTQHKDNKDSSSSQLTKPKLTPMFAQYLQIKSEHPDSLLFYRMGDFYELFYDDAVVAARELQIALTSRHKESDNPVPMCGVPWHAAKAYIAQLVEKGFHVAICEQVEDAKQTKGLVKREVIQVVTPGTTIEDDNLDAKSHNYLAAFYWDEVAKQGALAFVDASTGYWSGLISKKFQDLWQWVQKIAPRELLLPDMEKIPSNFLLEGVQVIRVAVRSHFDLNTNKRLILDAQGVKELQALNLEQKPELVRTAGALLVYLGQVQRCNIRHLQPFVPLDLSKHLIVDELTERNLELFVRLNGRKGVGTLWHVLDHTLTPMGGRLLELRLRHPWRNSSVILKQQLAVTYFYANNELRGLVREALKAVFDLERISTRINLQKATPRDYIALRNSLLALPQVLQAICLENSDQASLPMPESIQNVVAHWDNLEDCAQLLQQALNDSPPNVISDGGIFKAGYNSELDALMDLAEHGEQRLKDMLASEQQSANLPKLKLGYNRVFGYYFELSHSAQGQNIPEHFIRRQTLANAERFTTTALKNLEEQIMQAAEKRKSLEYNLFQELRERISLERARILFAAHVIAHVDYWQCLAYVARKHVWSAPELEEGQELTINEGRHPVVESIVGAGNFVPNDFCLDEKRRLCLLTGPNMAGKSTILRQTAIICLLAQMGSYVPASFVRMGTVDRIFSRVGASDNLAAGQSTFMVEMMETARILRLATKNSLVILDEIGRGTSTYDGLALAWAVVEELSKRSQGNIRTLFATHYHELTALEGKLERVFTMNIAICEHGGEIIFLHRLVPGPSDRSYGVEVARLAGVPMPVVQRAREILSDLELSRSGKSRIKESISMLPGINMPIKLNKNFEAPPSLPNVKPEPEVHPLISILQDCKPEEMSPMEALKRINEWKMLWGK